MSIWGSTKRDKSNPLASYRSKKHNEHIKVSFNSMRYITFIILAGALHSCYASPEIILDNTSAVVGDGFALNQGSLGQTFTLTKATRNISAGGLVRDANDYWNSDFHLTISIYNGAGFDEQALGSVTSTLPDGFDGLHTESFAFLGTLSPGEYTIGFSAYGSLRGELKTGIEDPGTDPYNNTGIFPSSSGKIVSGIKISRGDFAVLVMGTPVPGTKTSPIIPLLALSLIGLYLFFRRRVKLTMF